ncbi:hypothetical protein BC828DRAFT_391094 [Blastocladiella britannica]|nr:hypothetical protein BC828DRAFT_391094 [Blastocladiella britannica]
MKSTTPCHLFALTALVIALLSIALPTSAQACGSNSTTTGSAPCPPGLCCSTTLGYCTSSADACDPSGGCASGCSDKTAYTSDWAKSCPPAPKIDADLRAAILASISAQPTGPTVRLAARGDGNHHHRGGNGDHPEVFEVDGNKAASAPGNSGSTSSSARNLTASLVAKLPKVSCDTTVQLTACDLANIMGGPALCKYCNFYVGPINQALASAGMACPSRIAAFLAQMRHETQHLDKLWQPADNGAGTVSLYTICVLRIETHTATTRIGSLHLIPNNFHTAINDLPQLYDDVLAYLPQQLLSSDPASSASLRRINIKLLGAALQTNGPLQQLLASVVARPQNAFKAGTWWFAKGAKKTLGFQGCGDLRSDSDAGLGLPGDASNDPSGFFRVSQCIFGGMADAGLGQRIDYYLDALPVAAQLKPVRA